MDKEKLQKRLNNARLRTLLSIQNPHLYSFDLDLYSATKQAFKLLEADQALLLPRI